MLFENFLVLLLPVGGGYLKYDVVLRGGEAERDAT